MLSEKMTITEFIRQSRLLEDWLEGANEVLLLALEGRFGPLSDDIRAAIQSADEATLTAIAQHAATETLEQLRARLGLAN